MASDDGLSKKDILAVLAITAAARLAYYVSGVHFDASTLGSYMQFIDTELLVTRLLESLWYYHANPPILNLFTGTVLKLFGDSSTIVFSMTFHILGFLAAVALFGLTLKLGRSRRMAFILTSLFVVSPSFVLYENWLMYTFPTAVLLLLSAFALLRFAETESTRWGIAFFASLAVIALTRSMFHLAWVVVITAGVFLVMRGQTRRVAIFAVIPLLLVTGWYGKNYFLFGSFSASTWMGIGLSNISTLVVPKEDLAPLVEDGTLSKYALISRYEDRDQLFFDVEVPAKRIPVLHNKLKSSGAHNFNYASLIEINKFYTRDAFQVARHFPSSYATGLLISNRLFFSPGSMNLYFTVDNRVAASPMERFYNPLIYGANFLPQQLEQPHYGFSGKYRIEVNTGLILVITFPLVILFGLIRLFMMYRDAAPDRRASAIVLAYLLFNILYIYGLATFLELAENYRYRFIQEPLMLVVISLLLGDLLLTLRKNRSKKTTKPLETG